MADAAGVGGGIDAGPPAGPGSAVDSDDVVIFSGGQGGGLFDADDVVFEPEVMINVLLALEMAGANGGAVGKGEPALGGVPLMREPREKTPSEVLEVFDIRFADLPEEQTFEAGEALAIIRPHLGNEPVRLATAAGAAKADGGGAIGSVAEPGGGAGGELAGLQDDAGADKILHLVERAAGGEGGGGEMIGWSHGNGEC